MPFGCRKTVYVCDDGRDPVKRSFCHALCESGHAVVYVSGRARGKREINGKSCNINKCVCNLMCIFVVILMETILLRSVTSLLFPTEESAKLGSNVPFNEVLAVFDADQVAMFTGMKIELFLVCIYAPCVCISCVCILRV